MTEVGRVADEMREGEIVMTKMVVEVMYERVVDEMEEGMIKVSRGGVEVTCERAIEMVDQRAQTVWVQTMQAV